MKPLATLALCLTLTGSLVAQIPQFTDPANLRGERVSPRDGRELPLDQGALGLQQLLRKLNTRASILNIVAHPDDEDGGMLTLYARGLGARVADLSLTRGEGGQNAMTGDFEDALGLLRTQELLANDRYTGVSQMFGTEVDFGFSKTKSEAFAKWTHDRVLYDAVRAIRLVRPLVITATFIGGVTDGHGQHQVSGQIAQEAFLAAADPNVFPDMIAEGILPWQALRVYARVPQGFISGAGLYDYATNQYTPARFTNYVTGEITTTVPSTDVIVHEGATDPLLTPAAANPTDLPASLTTNHQPLTTSLSYVQFARIGLGLQRSQIGPGVRTAPSGAFDVAYHLYGSVSQSANGAPHTSLGRSPGSTHDEQDNKGLKARLITASLTANPSASGAPHTSLGRSPRNLTTEASQGPEARPIDASTDPNFFTGIDTSIESIATLAPSATGNISVVLKTNLAGIQHSIEGAQADFQPNRPELATPRLSEALTLTDTAIDNVNGFSPAQLPADQKENLLHELRIKRVQLNDAVALSLGLTFEATAKSADLEMGSPVDISLSLATTSSSPLYPCSLQIAFGGTGGSTGTGEDVWTPRTVQAAKPATATISAKGYMDASITRPYFTRDNIEQPVYTLLVPQLRNAPGPPPTLAVYTDLECSSTRIWLGRVVTSLHQPVYIVPPASLSIPHAQVLPNDKQSVLIKTSLYPIEKPAIEPMLSLPSGWTSHIALSDVYAPGEMGFTINVPSGSRKTAIIQASATPSTHETITEGYRSIGYGDLPRTNYYTPATTRIVPVDLKLPAKTNIAYLPGTGDAVPEALASIGLTPMILTVADLTATNLAKFDTVILGVRTYNAHPDLHGAPTAALLDFARNGGNVLVQYQTPEFTAADAPYPLSLGSNEKVVDETAPVKLLGMCDNGTPAHWCEQSNTNQTGTMPGSISDYKLLTTPNRITPADFNNWIEERGHGFLSTWDPHYTDLTETHDPGAPSEHIAPQLPQRGGLITTTLGKGRWTYCAFALYRQLPEAVPGAFRLFVNLLNP